MSIYPIYLARSKGFGICFDNDHVCIASLKYPSLPFEERFYDVYKREEMCFLAEGI